MPNNMQQKAKDLVQEMLNNGDDFFQTTFTIRNSDDEIVVIVSRASEPIIKELGQVTRATLNPSGHVCPTCGGSGRI